MRILYIRAYGSYFRPGFSTKLDEIRNNLIDEFYRTNDSPNCHPYFSLPQGKPGQA